MCEWECVQDSNSPSLSDLDWWPSAVPVFEEPTSRYFTPSCPVIPSSVCLAPVPLGVNKNYFSGCQSFCLEDTRLIQPPACSWIPFPFSHSLWYILLCWPFPWHICIYWEVADLENGCRTDAYWQCLANSREVSTLVSSWAWSLHGSAPSPLSLWSLVCILAIDHNSSKFERAVEEDAEGEGYFTHSYGEPSLQGKELRFTQAEK